MNATPTVSTNTLLTPIHELTPRARMYFLIAVFVLGLLAAGAGVVTASGSSGATEMMEQPVLA